MDLEFLRGSAIGTYNDCQWKYNLLYNVSIESKPNKKALLGTIVHHVLEILAKVKKTNHHLLKDSYSDVDYLLNICWNRYTKLYAQDFEFTDSDKQFCKDQINVVMNDKIFNPFNLDIISTELQFEITIKLPQFSFINALGEKDFYKIRGTIDLITRKDDDTLEIIDYKTGERKDWITGEEKSYDKIKSEIQFRVYDLAVKALFPEYKYRWFTMYFTRSGGPFTIAYEPHETEESIDVLRRYFQDISKNNYPSRLKDDSNRSMEKWKCMHVCQFGKIIHIYANENGDVIDRGFKSNQTPPSEIEVDGVRYHHILDTGTSYCDEYYQLYKKFGLKRSNEIIAADYKVGYVSKRNDYSGNTIRRGVIA